MGRPGEVEPVGGGFGRGALVRQNTLGALVDDLQRSDDTDRAARSAAVVGELDAVQGQRGRSIANQDPVGRSIERSDRPARS